MNSNFQIIINFKDFANIYLNLQSDFQIKLLPWLGHNRPLTLPEPEPTLPFDLPLSEPTYRHRPDLTAFLSPIFC